MEELEKTARELIWAITEKTLISLKDKGLLKEPSELQRLCFSPEMMSLIKKLSALKCGPNRLFRKGDIVTPKERNGRIPWKKDKKLIVVEDERRADVTVRDEESGEVSCICSLFLELVTPVEEMEPYIVRIVEAEGETEYHVEPRNNKLAFVAVYGDAHPYPKAAAEAECKRLNDECRKGRNEQS